MRRAHFRYYTNCIGSTMELIQALTASAHEITRRTFVTYADPDSLRELERSLAYDTGTERGGLRMANDWAVSYYRGTYDGRPCVFFVHSHIEHIFL